MWSTRPIHRKPIDRRGRMVVTHHRRRQHVRPALAARGQQGPQKQGGRPMPRPFMRDSLPGRSRGRESVRATTGRRRRRAGRSPARPGGRRPGAPGPDAGAGFPGCPGHDRGAARSIRGGRLRPRSRRARQRPDALPGGGPLAAAAPRGPGNDRPAPRPAVAVQPVPAGNRGMQVAALPGASMSLTAMNRPGS